MPPLDIVQAYEKELGVVRGTLVVVLEKARLELYGEDLSCRTRVDHILREEPRSRVAMGAILGGSMEPGLQDLRVMPPEPVASFTGRAEELHWLAHARTGPVVVTQALVGLGGVGKTALALEYAHRCFYNDHSVDLALDHPRRAGSGGGSGVACPHAGPQRVSAEPRAAAEVVRLCGYLPLAVSIAGARLATRPTMTVAALAGRLSDGPGRLAELSVGDVEVRASFASSYEAPGPNMARTFLVREHSRALRRAPRRSPPTPI